MKLTLIAISVARGQKKGFKHSEEVRKQIGHSLQGRSCGGFNKRVNCPDCNREMNPANLVKHLPACNQLARYQRIFRKNLSTRDLKNTIAHLRRNYKLSFDDYVEMYDKQSGACAICKGQADFMKSLSVDHCHEVGTIRGLLCNKCNSILGLCKDDISILFKAIEYLRNSKNEP